MRPITAALTMLVSTVAQAGEHMEKTPFQLSRAFSPGVITSGGNIADQTATQDGQGNNIANNFEAQVEQVFSQVDSVLKHSGRSLDNVVTMTVFIKESRYGDKFVEMRKDFFKNENYPGRALITVTRSVRPGIEIESQAVGVIGDACSTENPCSAVADYGIAPAMGADLLVAGAPSFTKPCSRRHACTCSRVAARSLA